MKATITDADGGGFDLEGEITPPTWGRLAVAMNTLSAATAESAAAFARLGAATHALTLTPKQARRNARRLREWRGMA